MLNQNVIEKIKENKKNIVELNTKENFQETNPYIASQIFYKLDIDSRVEIMNEVKSRNNTQCYSSEKQFLRDCVNLILEYFN